MQRMGMVFWASRLAPLVAGIHVTLFSLLRIQLVHACICVYQTPWIAEPCRTEAGVRRIYSKYGLVATAFSWSPSLSHVCHAEFMLSGTQIACVCAAVTRRRAWRCLLGIHTNMNPVCLLSL
ncbi:hypothetical protein V8C43DRAFT_316176 [Trichoderma afarasin]